MPDAPLDGAGVHTARRGAPDWSGLPSPSFVLTDMSQPSGWLPPGGEVEVNGPNNKQPPRTKYPLPEGAGLNVPNYQPLSRLEGALLGEGWLNGPNNKQPLRVDYPLPDAAGLPTLTPVAKAAAEVAKAAPVEPAAPAAPAAPKADPMELAALELVLADPANQAVIEQFGGELKPLPTWTSVGKGIEARYGADLGARLYQLQNAQRAVEGEFFQAMDAAMKEPPSSRGVALPMRRGDPQPTSGRPGWVYDTTNLARDLSGTVWKFDPGAFARDYAAGDSPAQRAFANLHGPDAVKFVPAPDMDGGGLDQWQLAGTQVRLGRPVDRDEGLTPEAFHAKDGWVTSGLQRPYHHLDPDRITKLNNKEAVWFDPVHGFSTDRDNLKGSWLDRAFPYLFAGAITAMTFGAGSTVAGGIASAAGNGTAGNIAVSASMAAVNNAALQLAANGKINFGQLLQSALAGGATAGISHIPGVGQYLDGQAGSFGQRLMEYTGRATVQGAIQAAMGGKFRDGMVNSLMGSMAGEVTAQLDAQIRGLKGLNPGEASALRLLSRATGSALRLVGSGDPAASFASDFLGGVMQEGLASYQPQGVGAPGSPAHQADPLGEFIAQNEQAWADRQAAYDQILAALNDPLAIDRSQDVLLAAGPGFAGLEGDGLGPDGVYRVTITGTGSDAAREELARIDQLLQSPSGQGMSRAGLYNDVVLDRFRQMSGADQRAMLAVLDNYANSLHDANALARAGLAPGSLEARRADLAMRIAADFARQSGAIPNNARFMADARAGMGVGLAAMVGAVAGRDRSAATERPNGPTVGGRGTQLGTANTGAIRLTFGRVENQISHTFRHVEAVGLNRTIVRDAVALDISRMGANFPSNPHNGSVIIDGRQINYVAYKLPDGTINVGRITP